MLQVSALGGAALMMPFARTAFAQDSSSPSFTPYSKLLPIPPVLEPARKTETTDFYEMTMKEGEAEILPGLKTPIWGYNGIFPGPTIEAFSGREVVVRHANGLSVPTSIHTHGAYVDGDSDGHPNNMIQPGEYKDYTFGNLQRARTQWYHDHAMHITATNVYRGLSGMYIIRDEVEQELPLPKGEYEVPLVIQDRMFNQDGSLLYPADAVSNEGFEGDVVLVNGAAQPRLEVANRKYRFRLLNGSNARPYVLALDSGRSFKVIASEGGLMESPASTTRLPIAPAERYEIVVDFSEYNVGDKVVLENLRVDRDEPTRRIMRFDIVREEADDSSVPEILCTEDYQYDDTHLPPDEANIARRREFRFNKDGSMFTINGLTFDKDRIDANPSEGATEIWRVYNNSGGWIHPVHIHLINFKILERNGRPPEPWEECWKDTVWVGENEDIRLSMRWPKVPVHEEPGDFAYRYVFHCHNLEHEDHDMMAQIGVQENEVEVVTVEADPEPGSFEEAQEVKLKASDSKARIFYTTDGSKPTPAGKLYEAEEIAVERSMTIKAVGVDAIGYRGPVASFAYEIAGAEPGSTSLTLDTSRSALTFGQLATLSGKLASDGNALSGKRVTIEHRPVGAKSFTKVPNQPATGLMTRDDGGFRLTGVKPTKNTFYRATFSGNEEFEKSLSAAKRVNVKAVVTNATSTKQIKVNQAKVISGQVRPSHTGTVKVTVKKGAKVVLRKNVRLNSSSYRFVYRPKAAGVYTVQATMPTHADHLAGTSPAKRFRVTR